MALTSAQQFVGCYIANGALGIAPGGYMTALGDIINANGSNYRAITKAVVGTSLFTDQFPTYLSNEQFAANYATKLLGTSVTAANMKVATDYITGQLNAGVSRGDAVYQVLEFLYTQPSTNADWGTAAATLQNKASVAQYYTVDKLGASTDLATLRSVTSSVTDAASVETAKASIDAAFAGTVSSAALTTGMDNVVGTGGDDSFTARIFDNSNTLQSGDKISGGSGTDTLFADIGNSQNFAITPETTGVERVAIRAQATPRDATNGNNTSSGTDQNFTNIVQIDAQRMSGVTQWESNNSRADVVIEDVRILDTQKTSAVTIAMVETDPGNVDFAVYFDQLSLRNTGSITSSLNVFLMDTAAADATPTTPLLNHNFNTYTFFNDGKKVILGGANTPAGTAIDDAKTYAQLKDAFVLALKTANVAGTVTDLSNTVTVTTSGPVNMTNEAAKSAESSTVAANFLGLTGEVITFTINGSSSITSSSGGEAGGWTAAGPAPSTGAIVQTLNSGTNSSAELVTSKVILDDVGRGSTGGDLVIGGQSTGDTSTSRGVERFEIEVRDNSKLQTINSTNNALREVTIVNGATSNTVENAYVKTVKDAGNLTVNGDAAQALAGGVQSGGNNQLPGVENNSPVGLHHGAGAAGFVDVRLIDASAFKGKLAFTADITADSIAKYVNLVDTNGNPVADVAGTGNVNFDVRGANFAYTGGSNNDTMVVTIDGDVAGSRSKVVSGQSDFTFDVTGGAGDDAITVSVITPRASNGDLNWYNNQDLNNNVTVSGGAGNDTIQTPGAGDVKIDGGAGNDTIYTDNTGNTNNSVATTVTSAAVKGQWVFNTADQDTAFGAAPAAGSGLYGAAARNVNDLRSDSNESYNFYNSKLVVTFKGIPTATAVTVAGTGYKTTDLEINQAIKKAINDDVVLNKLLLAEDGPANSLVVKSLIDGVMETADLAVTLTPLTLAEVTALSATEIAAAGAAYNITAPTAASVSAAITAAYTAFNVTNHDYATAMANDGAANITGRDSLSTSDNTVIGGAGDDVIVLGTTAGADATSTFDDSNEVLVYTEAFGKDVVVNFTATGAGYDAFDFSALLGNKIASSVGAVSNTDASVAIAADLVIPTGSTLIAEIKKLYTDDATTAGASKHVYVSYDADNVGKVYQIVDGAAANDLTITELGSIDLADSGTGAGTTGTGGWAALTTTNFVTASKVLNNGGQPTGTTPTTPTTPTGTQAATTVDGLGTDATPAALDANASTTVGGVATTAYNFTDNVATRGNVRITNFGADDIITISGGTSAAATQALYDSNISSSGADVQISYNNGGQLNLITLVGVNADGAFVNDVASFNALSVGDLVFA